eukprot:TRINITY_DN375_c15_g1_i1.p1 TRINITY_DN375_c15_g1~~TRINITY_DN375_c15_g1_i1.p1  ORF type:complete len:126 (+),score=13.69 TRINITY_DN375_c15_g1_i1:104-481(+)
MLRIAVLLCVGYLVQSQLTATYLYYPGGVKKTKGWYDNSTGINAHTDECDLLNQTQTVLCNGSAPLTTTKYSAYYTGHITIPSSGYIEFSVRHDDGFRLIIGSAAIISAFRRSKRRKRKEGKGIE